MNHMGKVGQIIGIALAVVIVFCASSVMAETITSPSYKINGNFGGSFGGQTNSTNYKMTSIGGEAIVGNGSSGSYIIDQQQSSASVQTMQLGVQPSGLVAYYPLDENTGTTTADASQYQNNGSLTGSAVWNSSGKIGSSVDINGPVSSQSGGGGSVEVLDNSQISFGSQMTFEAWVNSRDSSITKYIATQIEGTNSWGIRQLGRDISVIAFATPTEGITNTVYTNSDVLTSNTWHHVAFVYDGSLVQADRIKIYVDGVRKSGTVSGTIPSALAESSAKMRLGVQAGGNGVFNGYIDHVKLFNRPLSGTEILAEYTAQSAGVATGLALGTETNESKVSLVDAIVRTNVSGYNLAIQQDHDLQNGANTIPAISGGSIASPMNWSDGVTKGFGFTLINAPNLDSKWGSGASYAALPSSATTFYTNTGHVDGTVDVVNVRLRLDTDTSQPIGSYTNNLTYTGTMIP